jgi:hypothetical protein
MCLKQTAHSPDLEQTAHSPDLEQTAHSPDLEQICKLIFRENYFIMNTYHPKLQTFR